MILLQKPVFTQHLASPDIHQSLFAVADLLWLVPVDSRRLVKMKDFDLLLDVHLPFHYQVKNLLSLLPFLNNDLVFPLFDLLYYVVTLLQNPEF